MSKEANRFFNEIELLAERQSEPFRIAIKTFYRVSADKLENGGINEHDNSYTNLYNSIEIALNALYRRTIIHFANRQSFKFNSNLFLETKATSFELELLIQEYINNYSAEFVASISETTREKIVAIIERRQEEGLSNYEIAQEIRELSEIDSKLRARRIAITETHNVANYASFESTVMLSNELNVKVDKTWVSVHDSRTRAHHSLADGQTVDITEPFIVNGEEMMHPGDRRASAGNTIHCRCTVIFKVRKEENF